MINIAICDDDIIICEELESIILDYKNNINININIDIFYSGEIFLKYISSNNNYDVLFLDIELNNINGVEIGHFIRNELKNHYIKIIYISSFDKYAMKLFELSPSNFLIKPIDKNKIEKNLSNILNIIGIESEVFNFKALNGDIIKIPVKDIFYFEIIKSTKNIKIITNNIEKTFLGTLNEVHEKVGKDKFIRINKSIIVSFNHIKLFNPKELKIVLVNNKELIISRLRLKDIKEEYFNFLTERNYRNGR
nr:LytTR family DNA-binding domain-containing protein [uncultured Tyzzerella sp.]